MQYNEREDHELQVRVTWYYYKSGMTQEEIANRLALNRARVAKFWIKPDMTEWSPST